MIDDITNSEILKTSQWLQKVNATPSNRLYKLLIVDDQLEIRNLLSITLDAVNYEVQQASDWMTALTMIQSIKPDLVLLDIMMPGEFDGLEVCKRIKNDKELSSTIIIIVSARSQAADRYNGLEAGADDYITKPFSPLALMEKVNQLLTKSEHKSL